MTEEEYRKSAKEAGYDDEEIEDLVSFQKESGLPFEALPLIERIID